jgi:pyruvate dehydrogenase E1 component beta subunit
MPSTPHDAKGMLKSAIREDCPVMFFEHMQLYREKGPVPGDDYTVPIGPAEVRRDGGDITVVASGLMVSRSLAAAETLAGEDIDTEVIDLRTLKPWDRDAVTRSVNKTGRLVVVHESWTTGGIGGEIVSRLMEDAATFSKMRWAPARSAALDVPVFDGLLDQIIPDEGRIADTVRRVVKAA